MIIEIAMGIVLGVLILRFLPVIITVGSVALALAGVGTVIVFTVLWIASNEWLATRAMLVGAIASIAVVGHSLGKAVSSRTVFTEHEVRISLLLCLIVLAVMAGLFVLTGSHLQPPLEPSIRFVVLPTLSFWCVALLAALASKLRRIFRARSHASPEQ